MKRVNLVQIGVGLIGCTTIEQVLENRQEWQSRLGLDITYRGLVDFDVAVACDDPDGYAESTLRKIIEARKQRHSLSQIAADLTFTARTGNEVIDLVTPYGRTVALDTATGDETIDLDAYALSKGAGLVFSNKAPFAKPRGNPAGDAIWAEATSRGRVHYETTCGAGLPVISTLQLLLDTGDEVIEIVGAVSGTFGAIFSDVANGTPFSQAVNAAKDNGYTEPDPRDDLSGLDVARKALILARTMGRRVNLDEIAIENLVPETMRGLSVADFLDRVSELDDEMAARASNAKKAGEALKYVATVGADGPIGVGLRTIPTNTVLGALQGPENIISFRTKRYDAYPLNITGPGAGAAVTAAGVVADVLTLATGALA